jgi:PAS domain S-box-containing protein
MAQASYSFIDVAALDKVRERFAAGDALVILSVDLEEVIWANGPGAALFGHADVEAALGAEAPLGAAAKRQIAAIRGFPAIGRDRALLVRVATGVSSRALQFLASAVTLPDGEKAILLAQPAGAGEAPSKDEIASHAIGGFAAAGHFLAFVDAEGAVEAASLGFARLGLAQDALADMAREASQEQRIVKRMLTGRRGPLPAGLAWLTDARHLLVVIDENFAEEPEEEIVGTTRDIEGAVDVEAAGEAAILAEQLAAEQAAQPAREIWYLGSADVSETPAADVREAAGEKPVEAQVAEPMQAEAEPVVVSGAIEPTKPKQDATEAGTAQPEAVESPAAEPEAEPVAEETAAQPVAEQPASPQAAPQEPAPARASQELPPVQRATGPVRFVWRTDADGKFSQISPEFALAVGDLAADVVGRRFQDVANAFGLDPTGEIAGLLARRDTWSGRSVAWPVAGTDLKVPVDLAALPVYDRNRNFEGFRGFGVARTGDAVADPEAIGLVLVRLPETIEPEAEQRAEEPAVEEPKAETTNTEEGGAAEAPKTEGEEPAAVETAADPFRGEKPALTVAPAPDRRFSDKVIRLAEHRQPANDRGPNGSAGTPERSLSSGERIAFQQIGERLKKESGAAKPETGGSEPSPAAGPAETPKSEDVAETAGPVADARKTEPIDGQVAAEEPDETIADAGEIAELEALDGVDGAGEQIAEDASEAAAAEAVADSTQAAEPTEAPREPAAESSQEPAATPEEPPARTRKAGRPGMSLLDFAQWGKDEHAAQDGAVKPAALVEMEEAAALDERAPVAEEIAAAEAGTVEIEPAAGETGDEGEAKTEAPAETDVEAPEGAEAVETVSAAKQIEAEAADVRQTSLAEHKAGLSILERLPVPVLVHSGDTLHYANDEFFALTGYRSIEELAEAGGIGALFADPYEDDADYEPRTNGDRQMRLKTREGDEFPVEAFLQSVPWENGKALLLVLSRAKEGAFGGQSPLIAELEARVAEMRTIIDTATDGVVLIARDGNIRSISRPAEALFGMDSDEVTGKPFFSLFAIESQKAARDYLNGLTDHGVASVLNDGREVIGREAEGRFIPLFMTIGKLPGDSGYCAVVRDITQWKRAEEELTQARATAERASSHKTDFLARVSHEIRTPLNAIIGFSELMLDEKFGPVANDRYRDYLRDINRSGNHVLDLVNDLLDISKIEAGQQEMAYEAVSLNETLAETVAMMQPQANRERVIIRSSFASKLPDVVADLRSVRQIALNVLSNAVRYTQAGGQVIVSTAYEAQGEVVLRVRDTGIGMTAAEIEQALKPFKQINSLKRTRGDGTGLGLPLTKAMVEANRAKFSIHSTPGEGTLVEVAFPSTRVLAD